MARRQIGIQLSTKAHNALIRLKKANNGSKSQIVEALILAFERVNMPHDEFYVQLEDVCERYPNRRSKR
jgi:hypothetical protein